LLRQKKELMVESFVQKREVAAGDRGGLLMRGNYI